METFVYKIHFHVTCVANMEYLEVIRVIKLDFHAFDDINIKR